MHEYLEYLSLQVCNEVMKIGDRVCVNKRNFHVVGAWFNVYSLDLSHGARPGDPVTKGLCPDPGFQVTRATGGRRDRITSDILLRSISLLRQFVPGVMISIERRR